MLININMDQLSGSSGWNSKKDPIGIKKFPFFIEFKLKLATGDESSDARSDELNANTDQQKPHQLTDDESSRGAKAI